eukprot:scaffold317406_cov40-Tisochrysis_lutea.AAC.1
MQSVLAGVYVLAICPFTDHFYLASSHPLRPSLGDRRCGGSLERGRKQAPQRQAAMKLRRGSGRLWCICHDMTCVE